MTIWFDVEDLFDYALTGARPSGIQRLSYEIFAAAQVDHPGRIGFLRHDSIRGTMHVAEWRHIDSAYRSMTARTRSEQTLNVNALADSPTPILHSPMVRLPVVGNALRSVANRLPTELRVALGQAARAQVGALGALGRATRALPRAFAQLALSGNRADRTALGPDLREAARPGDTIAIIGAPWSQPDHARFLARIAEPLNLRVAVLVYDLIPMVRPEFCERGHTLVFSAFMRSTLQAADRVMAISEATAADTAALAAREGLPMPNRPTIIPIGTGFTGTDKAVALPSGLAAGGYALFVSTVEARKNHLLAFRAWRRLLDELPPERVPQLVFAGRIGWMVADLMQQIRNAENLGGKLVIVQNPDDATLAALYRGARFTLFPSHYEGWGLPVSESLAFGKVCLASNSTSIPEAGGPFCLYHDPDSVTEAVALYRRAIEEPGLIESLEAKIAAEYRPTPWSATATAVLDALS